MRVDPYVINTHVDLFAKLAIEKFIVNHCRNSAFVLSHEITNYEGRFVDSYSKVALARI